jgi:primosomal protein N' (replication factor Y)
VCQRMDSDTMSKPGSHQRVLDAFRDGLIQILVGTQMIAKGLDFPNVTLVGVVNADVGLHLPDFRSAERTFQLLAQVAGRAGRGEKGGNVLVQTFTPDHPCITLASHHNYAEFAKLELVHRKQHRYPPFERMARLIVRSEKEEAASAFADTLAGAFKEAMRRVSPPSGDATRQPAKPSSTATPGVPRDLSPAKPGFTAAPSGFVSVPATAAETPPPKAMPVRLLGPAECPVFKLNGFYRFHFQLQSDSSAVLHEVLRNVLALAKPPSGVEFQVDIDPYSML